ncbi:MAG: recombinase family protein [Oscillospiraceae bacterium]|nr:recombinase family protein [Oscillospiraceae bacterium]
MSRRNRIPKSTEKYLARKSVRIWNTALYARLSVGNNGFEDDRSLRNQIKYLEEYTEKHPDLVLVDRYVDNGKSGLNFERAEFQRMMEDVKTGRINCVLVKDLSRFGRNYVEAGYYLETIFPELGVRFISLGDSFDSLRSEDSDSIILPLKNIINEMYARETQRKILAVLRAKERAGERPFGMAPYGYMVDPECNYHLLPDPNTSAYVRLIFGMKSQGCKLAEIADRLNEAGAPTPLCYLKSKGKYKNVNCSGRWDYVSVQKLLENRTYTGATVYNRLGKGDYTVIPDTHEALVDTATFDEISREMQEKGKHRADSLEAARLRREKYPNILKGKFFCGDCGRAMLYDQTGSSGIVRNFRYRCSGYSDYRKDDAGAPPCSVIISAVPEQRVHKFVIDELRQHLSAGGFRVEELPPETTGIIHLSDTSWVEIVAVDAEDPVERLLRRGLTNELMSDYVEKLWYRSDGSLSIQFKAKEK